MSTETTAEQGGPNYRFKNAADGSLVVTTVEHDYEKFADDLSALVYGETSTLWLHVGEVIEKLAPDISPFDKREAIAEILAPVKRAFADAFS